jgi:predicted metalloprotease with PDZ domain
MRVQLPLFAVMPTRLRWGALFLLVVHATAAHSQLPTTSPEVVRRQRYEVSVNFQEPLHATVQATLTVPDGKLFTHGHAGGYEWSDYVKNLRVFGEDGRAIPIESAGHGQWTLGTSEDQTVHVAYDVDLSFTREMREGAQRGGQFFGHSLYIVNRALFVMTNSVGPRNILFILPARFEIATPWKSVARASYLVQDNSELVDNTTVIGSFPSFQISDGNFHLTMVLPSGTPASQSLIQPVLQSVLHEYILIFPKTPEFHVLMSFFHGVETNGEAYRDSGALTSPDSIEMNNRVLWASYLAHELFHHWNGNLIAGNDDGKNFGTTEWFAEGATEYMANRALVRAGIISRDAYLRKMETNIGMYEYWTWAAPSQGVSIQDAGAKTTLPMPDGMIAKTYNRPGVYSGGWVASFCVDTMIQTNTKGKKGLDDVFRALLTNYGLTGKQWTAKDLVHLSSEAAGTDLSKFFEKHVASPNPLPVTECLANAGFDGSILNYSGEAYVSPKQNPGRLAQEIREHLWSGRN